jgi:NADP-dependent 3-hydroxy acid dehydrogenase YdfG
MTNRCEHFAEQGCTVHATSRRLETMEDFKHPVEKRVMDVTSDDQVALTIQSILEEQGKIDVVVNNAGAITIGLSDLLRDNSSHCTDCHIHLSQGRYLICHRIKRNRGLTSTHSQSCGLRRVSYHRWCSASKGLSSTLDPLQETCE